MMGKEDFEKLLNNHAFNSNGMNWDREKQEWLALIKSFYDSVELWFKPFCQSGKLSYKYYKHTLTEEDIGTYQVDAMTVNFAGQELTIKPLGTLLIGTKGRIDMEGTRGIVRFILADKDSKAIKINVSASISMHQGGQAKEEPKEPKIRGSLTIADSEREAPTWTWKIVLREPTRRIHYADFTEENFFDALMEIVNG